MKDSKLYVFKKGRKTYYTTAKSAEEAIDIVNLGFGRNLVERHLTNMSDSPVVSFGGKE